MSPAPAVPRPRRSRKPTAVRRGEIAEAALRILAERGGRHLTARELARAVGISEGAIFRHFPDMEAVVNAVVERMGALLFEGFPPGGADAFARLRSFFERRVRIIAERPCVSRLLLGDEVARAAGPARAARVRGFKRRSQRFVVGCLEEAAAVGQLAPGVRPEAAAVLVLGAILALGHATARVRAGRRVEDLAGEVWAALERALRGGAPEGKPGRRKR
jgi:AcrR family transcriptional regulator